MGGPGDQARPAGPATLAATPCPTPSGRSLHGRQPEIDPARIGIIGFSWGGVVTLLSATRRVADALSGDGPAFAAHAAFYPVCWSFMPSAPMAWSGLTGRRC